MCGRDKSVSQHIRCLQRYMISTTFLSYCLGIFAVIPLSSFSLSLFMYFLYFYYYYYFIFNVYHLSNLCFGDLLTFPSLSQSLSTSRPPKDFSSKTNITQRHQSASEDFSSKINITQRHQSTSEDFSSKTNINSSPASSLRKG